uniref:Calmodulin-lysine N-methyltransferase n=1 Tax=Zooxanthella nutricula TaxID=1333877 RepID=A0A7S2K6T6_9DINO
MEEEDRGGAPADAAGGSLRSIELSWGEEGFDASALGVEMAGPDAQPFDFVISAELVYLEETHDLLLYTWQRLCSPQTQIYSVFINRPFSWNFFAKLHDLDHFEVAQLDEERDFDPCGLEECHMHVVTLKG